jgi:hypothetical protein
MTTRIFLLQTEVIRDLLDRRHRSHRGFAEDLAISSAYWSQVLNRRRHMTPELRRRLLDHPLVRQAGLSEADLWTVHERP